MGLLMLGSDVQNPSPPKKKWIRHYFLEESPAASNVFTPTSRVVSNGSHCLSTATPSSFSYRTPSQSSSHAQQAHSSHSSSRLVTREVHNNLEKKRRAQLKECFELLKKQVPISPDDKKTSNLSILHSAIRYIQVLRRKDREYEHELERLAREKIAAQQRLSTLKKDLTAQWDHIDFNTLLPNSAELESRKRSKCHSESDVEIDTVVEEVEYSVEKPLPIFKCCGVTAYSSPSSLSSASPQLQTVCSPMAAGNDFIPHRVQIVQGAAGGLTTTNMFGNVCGLPRAVNPPSPGLSTIPSSTCTPTSQHLVVSSGSTIQLLPSTTLRMIPETQLVQSSVAIPNGVIGHRSVSGTLSKKRSNPDSMPSVQTGGIARMVNHPIVVQQQSGQLLLPIAKPTKLSGKVVGPILKPVNKVPIMNAHQLLVKPGVVVVSSPSNTSTKKLC